MELRAYHGDTKLKAWCVNEMKSHRIADALRQGYGYWKDGAGCGVGCLIKGSDHSLYETKFGIPEMLARLEDCIFEGLPVAKAQKWPERFLASIDVGQDLSLVGWEFQHRLQINNLKFAKKQKFPDDVIKAIENVIENVTLPMSKGKTVLESAAWSAARSAESAARSAARSAESAAWSAESAAWSAARSAESAVRSAARSAESAAWSAARSAESAARSAARSAESAAWSAESAAWSAESAAWSAARSAESAVRSAARSAESAAYEEMADMLINIIKHH